MKDVFKAALLLIVLLGSLGARAQWSAPYANSWIKYGKPYVKIGVAKKGLYRIPFSALPKNFPVGSPEKLQLWRRGRQVSIISTDHQEIVFYGLPNDGASDSLLYRPATARMNPYFSMYSDEGAYFLTAGDAAGSRASVVNQPVDAQLPPLASHNEHFVKLFQEDYSLSTKTPVRPHFFNSFFELGASRTSEPYEEGTDLILDFKLEHYVETGPKPTIKLLLHGRSNNSRKIQVYIGKNKGSLRLLKALENTDFAGVECTFEMEAGDVDAEKSGILLVKSVSGERSEGFSVAYFSVRYPQSFQMGKLATKEFALGATTEKWSRASVEGLSSKFMTLDVSDADNPIVLKATGESLMIPRKANQKQLILATSETTDVVPAKISTIDFKPHDPKAGNYIIITTDELREGAAAFAEYRSSSAGGSFKPLIVNIRDIYDQFNYGEPSPVGIKRFMSYMLSDHKDKYLFLIGKSITQNEKMVRELPGEVPTIGYPGSDILLVEGIAGAPVNAPAIPVGRLSAITNQQIMDYLEKVKAYESNQSGEYAWRKKVLHISGGKTTSEILQLKNHLRGLESYVMNGLLGGKVTHYVKQQPMEETESVNITKEVNEGVGLITLFGHGAAVIVDPNIGYARDAARGYNNVNKYPVMFFLGCGVGNVFGNRFNVNPPNPKSTDRIPLSLDWLLAPGRGAIAVVAGSYESFANTGINHLEALYQHALADPTSADLSIGKIHWLVSNEILEKFKDKHHIAHVHQSLLQGDPALKLITVDRPDYAIGSEEGITLVSGAANQPIGEADSLRVSLALSNFGGFVKEQQVRIKITCAGKNGTQVKTMDIPAFPSEKVLKVAFRLDKEVQTIRAEIDPERAVNELTRNNNIAELDIEWDLVKDKPAFSNANNKDNIPPIIEVEVNGRRLKQGEPVLPEPKISIAISDNRLLHTDTTLVDLFIKRCAGDDCDFERVTYAGGKLTISETGSKELALNYPSDLAPGEYEIMVNAKDQSGNAVVQQYRMPFKVEEPGKMQYELVVSPNPATSYLRFEVKTGGLPPVKSVRYVIHDQRGNGISDKTFAVPDNSSVLEWYWQREAAASGQYIYKVFLIEEEEKILGTKSGVVSFP